jgi:Ser/Thr protein kinase RdoA (MazF antagonist)
MEDAHAHIALRCAEACAAHFDLGALRETPRFAARGQANPLGIWRLNCTNGVFALKLYDAAPNVRALTFELAAHRAGAPLPRPHLTRDGHACVRVLIDSRDVYARVSDWVDGAAFAWNTVNQAISARVGALLARVHATPLAADMQEVPGDFVPAAALAEWRELAARAGERGLLWAGVLERQLSVIASLADFVATCGESGAQTRVVLSQRDYHPPNVIQRPDGSLLLVDWDAAGLAVASADIAHYAYVWATHESGEVDRDALRAFVRGYRDAGGVFTPQGAADFAPGVNALLHWTLFNLRRDLDDPSRGDPELSAALLAGLSPLDVAAMERKARELVV